MCLRMLRFFFEADRATISVKLDHAVTPRVAHLITENARTAFNGERFAEEIEFPVKDVVAQDQTSTGIADKFRANQERFRDAARFRLLRILNLDSKLRAVAQKIAQHRQIFWRGNNQHIA